MLLHSMHPTVYRLHTEERENYFAMNRFILAW